jgi:hypothetical protein
MFTWRARIHECDRQGRKLLLLDFAGIDDPPYAGIASAKRSALRRAFRGVMRSQRSCSGHQQGRASLRDSGRTAPNGGAQDEVSDVELASAADPQALSAVPASSLGVALESLKQLMLQR